VLVSFVRTLMYRNEKMSTKPAKKEVKNSEFKERSEKELLEEEIKNQETLDFFIESDKNWY